MVRGSFALGVAVAAIATAAPAWGDDRPTDAPLPGVTVHRTDDTRGCPDAKQLAALVDRQMKRESLAPDATPAALEVQIYKSEQGFTAVIVAGDKTRQISEKGATCARLAEALAVTIAILLDAGLELPPRPSEPKPPGSLLTPHPVVTSSLAPPPAPPAEPELPAPTAEEEEEETKGPRAWNISAALGGAAVGLTVGMAPAFVGTVEARASKVVSIDGGILYVPTTAVPFGDGFVEVSLTASFLRASFTLLGSPNDLASAGAYFEPFAGAMQGVGVGYANVRAQSRPWFALSGGLLAGGRFVGPIGWFAHGGVVLPLVRDGFYVGETRTPGDIAVQTPAVGADFDGGLRVTIY